MFSSNPERVQHGSETNNQHEGSTAMTTDQTLESNPLPHDRTIRELEVEVARLSAELKGESELYIQKARELISFKAQVFERLEEAVQAQELDLDAVNEVLSVLDLPAISRRQRYELSISVIVEVDADGDNPDWDNVTFDVDLDHADFTVSEGTVDDVYVNSVDVESNEAA